MTENRNAAIHFVDRHLAEGRGDNVAFREAGSGRATSYAALSETTGRVADALERAGIMREERVACIVLDQIEYPAIFWGALKAGVIPVALNTLLATPIYEAILRDSRAAAVFISHELWQVAAPAIAASPYIRKVIVIGGETPQGAMSWDEFMTGATPRDPIEVGADECAFWLYSSGSTGQPKGVRHCHGALQATADTYGAQILDMREDDVVFSAAKIFFAYGLGNAMTFPMSVGATTILFAGRPTPEAVLDIFASEAPTIFCGVPTLYAATCAHLDAHGAPDLNLRMCISAGEALPKETGATWEKHFGTEILDGVGSTEMLHIFLSNRAGEVVYGTSGVAVPGYDVRLVDEAGRDVADEEIGELLVRGDSAADGYWNQRAKSRATFEGEWTRTGDKYVRRADGRLVICGRTDDMFKVSGIWVSPFEVEMALQTHPDVMEAAVVPDRDDDGLEKPRAYVVLKPGRSADGLADVLRDTVKERIGKWKYPRWIDFVDDLPKTSTGKIQRFMLRRDRAG